MQRITAAKQIPDDKFLTAVRIVAETHGWGNRWEVQDVLSGLLGATIPRNVFSAKARRLILAKKMDGCYCGCRGDFTTKPS